MTALAPFNLTKDWGITQVTDQEKTRSKARKLSDPKPVELPSGKWRCQVTVDGARKSVIDNDPEIAHIKAKAIKAKMVEAATQPKSITLSQAIDRYIESKDAVLSPATIAGYKRIRENALQGLMTTRLQDLTQEKVQREINHMAKTKSPKSVRNAHGLLSATLAEYKPDMVLRTTLPQKVRYDAQIPSGEDIIKIMQTAKGTIMELPVLLALWLGLRMSEILGLTWDSVGKDVVHIKQAIVDGIDSVPTEKGTKSYSGNRTIKIPEYLKSLILAQPKTDEHIVTLSRRSIGGRFTSLCKRAGVPHYRFHDLRHANASVMLALGIPDKYAMERMGHATNNMLKTVYQHTMSSKQEEVSNSIDAYFEEKLLG
ncbi:conserved hypothetical protein [uncultured Eubacteriales bacterium]|uniref:Integrase n=1 Tax=uncultured Eubacteriales bacterium TaxID=172733 RepID=A0A212J3E2_9FIRM|nr:conserved hypothetical protein [uncultured Eubacteriales bacterium]